METKNKFIVSDKKGIKKKLLVSNILAGTSMAAGLGGLGGVIYLATKEEKNPYETTTNYSPLNPNLLINKDSNAAEVLKQAKHMLSLFPEPNFDDFGLRSTTINEANGNLDRAYAKDIVYWELLAAAAQETIDTGKDSQINFLTSEWYDIDNHQIILGKIDIAGTTYDFSKNRCFFKYIYDELSHNFKISLMDSWTTFSTHINSTFFKEYAIKTFDFFTPVQSASAIPFSYNITNKADAAEIYDQIVGKEDNEAVFNIYADYISQPQVNPSYNAFIQNFYNTSTPGHAGYSLPKLFWEDTSAFLASASLKGDLSFNADAMPGFWTNKDEDTTWDFEYDSVNHGVTYRNTSLFFNAVNNIVYFDSLSSIPSSGLVWFRDTDELGNPQPLSISYSGNYLKITGWFDDEQGNTGIRTIFVSSPFNSTVHFATYEFDNTLFAGNPIDKNEGNVVRCYGGQSYGGYIIMGLKEPMNASEQGIVLDFNADMSEYDYRSTGTMMAGILAPSNASEYATGYTTGAINSQTLPTLYRPTNNAGKIPSNLKYYPIGEKTNIKAIKLDNARVVGWKIDAFGNYNSGLQQNWFGNLPELTTIDFNGVSDSAVAPTSISNPNAYYGWAGGSILQDAISPNTSNANAAYNPNITDVLNYSVDVQYNSIQNYTNGIFSLLGTRYVEGSTGMNEGSPNLRKFTFDMSSSSKFASDKVHKLSGAFGNALPSPYETLASFCKTKLTTLEFPPAITHLAAMFYGNDELTSVVLPTNLTGNAALTSKPGAPNTTQAIFKNNPNLTDLYIDKSAVSRLTTSSFFYSNDFSGVAQYGTLHVTGGATGGEQNTLLAALGEFGLPVGWGASVN